MKHKQRGFVGHILNVFAFACAFGFAAHGTDIPDRYVPLDWVEANGSQWVFSDYTPLCTDRFEISVQLKDSTATQCFFCSRGINTTTATFTSFLINGTSLRFDYGFNQGALSEFNIETEVDYTIVADGSTRKCTVNGEEVETMSNVSEFWPASPISFFASHTSGMSLNEKSGMDNWARYRFYYFRVYNQSGKLVREFIPAVDTQGTNAVSQCGLYETQTGTFHPNLGSKPFPLLGHKSSVTLEANEEWDGITAARHGMVIDLNGHNLRLHAFDVPATITNSSATVSELLLDNDEDASDASVGIFGNIKVVKEGTGAYSAAHNQQTFTGGLEIREGKLLATINGSNLPFGAEGGEVRVGADATIDMQGNFDYVKYTFVLDGSTLTSSASPASAWTKAMVSNVRVGADSTFDFGDKTYGIINSGYTTAALDLDGHTLTVNTGPVFYFANTVTTAGTLVLNGTYEFYRSPSDFQATDLIVNGWLHVNSNCGYISVGNCVFNTPHAEAAHTFTAGIRAYGILRPNTDYFHGCEMQDGSTLDLSGRTGIFHTTSKNTGTTTAMTTITFAPEATVTVNLRGRELSEGMCIMRWDTKPDDTVGFAFDEETAALGADPVVAEDGLYYGTAGTPASVARATWTGAAGDGDLNNPANWSCVNAAGTAVADALPAETTDVTIEGDVSLNVPPGASIPSSKIIFKDCRLTADCDWRGLGTLDISGTINLNGKTLRVAGLEGGGTITSPFDLTLPEPDRASTTTTLYRGVASNLFNNNFERQVDTAHRIICTNANLPCVVDYDFGENTIITAYKIHIGPQGENAEQGNRAPSSWQFLGSIDGVEWVLLDEREDVKGWLGWECRTFTFENSTPYRLYRIYITKAMVPADGYMELVQLEYGLAEIGFGTLQIDVPADEEVMNNCVLIDGNVRVEKTGAGSFIALKSRQTYNMGTQISGGFVRFGTSDAPLGRNQITLGAGATLDLGSGVNYSYGMYNLDLAGTVIATNATTQRIFGNISLSGDATIVGRDDTFAFMNIAASPSLLALNGHTLTVEANGFTYIGAWSDNGTGGKLVLKGNEGARFETTYGYGPASSAVEFKGGAIIKGNNGPFDVGDFIYEGASWQLNTLAYTLAVHGTFRPGAMYPALTMCDGSTLDLSGESAVWSVEGLPAVAGSGNPRDFTEPGLVSFENGAMVTVDVHGRAFNVGDMIISWPRKPENVTFVFDEATAAAGIAPAAGETGLLYGSAGAVEIATWTGAAGDGDVTNPVNWSCADAAGTAVPNGMPHSGAVVRISGNVSLQIPASTSIPYSRIELDNCVLTADCDWRGLDFSRCSGNTIDLRGHKLYVTNLGGDVTIMDTTTEYDILDYINVASGAWVHTGYTPSCNDRAVMKIRPAHTDANKCLYCARTTNYKKSFTAFMIGNKFRFDRDGGNVTASLALNASTDYEVIADGRTLEATINGGNRVTMTAGDFTPGSAFVLFASHGSGPGVGVANYFTGRFYHFRVYNPSGTLMREFLPARRLADGAVGLLETTNNSFFMSNTSTGFTEGEKTINSYGHNPGELHVTVPDGEICDNTATSLLGNLKLVKEGEGTLVGSCAGQTYGGGTVIACGTALARTAIKDNLTYYEAQYYWGGENTKLTIEQDAVFDICGQYAFRVHNIVMNGGTLANSGPDQTNTNYGGIGNVKFTADSTFDLPCSTMFYALDKAIDLNGHTLTVRLGSDKTFWIGELFKNGTVEVVSGGWVRPYQLNNFDMPTVNLRLSGGAALWLGINCTVNEFSMNGETEVISRGIYPVDVLGQYQPQGQSDGLYGCLLHNGAVLDLSLCEEELQARSPDVWGCGSTTYAEDSTITIHLVGREVHSGERLVAWETPPNNVKFVLDEESRLASRCNLKIANDGIYVLKGLIIILQ